VYTNTVFEYLVSTAGKAAAEGAFDGIDVVVVDPPRKGLEAELVDLLAAEQGVASTAHTLLYLSCGFQSFRRDVKALTAGGAWRVAHLQAFSFFPGTNHLESLAVLQRTTAHT